MPIHPSRQAYVEEEQQEAQESQGISIADLPIDTNYEIPSATGEPSQHAATVLGDFARKRRAAALAVPTDDQRVRTELRTRGEPITLFGERKEDRRDRLRALMLSEQEGGDDEDEFMADADDDGGEGGDEEGEFYIEGSQDLLAARRDIARFSLPRAKQRLEHQRRESKIPVATHVRHRKAIKEKLSQIELQGSEIASDRPISIVRFSPNGKILASGDWGGSIKLLNMPNLQTRTVMRGHKGMVGGISWYPGATLPHSAVGHDNVNLATAAVDGEIHLWSLNQDTPVASLSGHSARVVRVEFHPSGKYLASASYDTTWRLWDVNTTKELLLQEGHSKEVYTVNFNEDGSLVASAGLDSIGRIWDMRTGRTVMLLESHVAPIHALDWGSDGTRVLTGSADGLAKCWDLRAVRETASIPAHTGGVSDLKWYKGTDGPLSGLQPQADVTMTNGHSDEHDEVQPKKAGTFIVSSGFDKTVNIFSADDWAPCHVGLTGHDGTVLSVDVTSDASWIASCGRDRTVKLWARNDMQGI